MLELYPSHNSSHSSTPGEKRSSTLQPSQVALRYEQVLQLADAEFDDDLDSEGLQAQWHIEEVMAKSKVIGSESEPADAFVPEHEELEYQRKMGEADNQLASAMDKERQEGVEAATNEYERALYLYTEALCAKPLAMPDPDYTFYLRLARCQSRLGSSTALAPYKSPKDIQHPFLPFIDRNDHLIELAEDNYSMAIAQAGGNDAPQEVKAIIFEQRNEMNTLFAGYKAKRGMKHEARKILETAKKDIIAAEHLLHSTVKLEIAPDLPQNIEEQKIHTEELKTVLNV